APSTASRRSTSMDASTSSPPSGSLARRRAAPWRRWLNRSPNIEPRSPRSEGSKPPPENPSNPPNPPPRPPPAAARPHSRHLRGARGPGDTERGVGVFHGRAYRNHTPPGGQRTHPSIDRTASGSLRSADARPVAPRLGRRRRQRAGAAAGGRGGGGGRRALGDALGA